MGAASQILSPAALFSLSGPGILGFFKSPSVYDVSAGKLSIGAEVFSDRAHTLMSGMKCGLLKKPCLLHQTDGFRTANV